MEKVAETGVKTRMRMTPQRMAVLDYLKDNKSHPSAADVFRAVSERFPTISFATVYNTLQMLKDRGRVTELSMDPDKKRFDPDPAPHHHVICIRCRAIMDITRTFDLELPEGERHGFEIVGNHVDFYGLCLRCREKEEKDLKPKPI